MSSSPQRPTSWTYATMTLSPPIPSPFVHALCGAPACAFLTDTIGACSSFLRDRSDSFHSHHRTSGRRPSVGAIPHRHLPSGVLFAGDRGYRAGWIQQDLCPECGWTCAGDLPVDRAGIRPSGPGFAPDIPREWRGSSGPSALGPRHASPNPMVSHTNIYLSSSRHDPGGIWVADASGRILHRLSTASRDPRMGTALWDGRDNHGRRVSAGTYFMYSPAAPDRQAIRIVVLD